jgi:hypothetical protein
MQFLTNGLTQLTASGTPLYLNRLSSDGEIVSFRKDGSTVSRIGTNGGLSYFAGTSIGLKISGTQIRPSNSIGQNNDNAVDLGKSDTRFKDLYLSGGVNFSANSNAAGMTSELLDDYEEGTWTGRLASSTSGGTNYDSAGATGRYIKIGRLVHIQIHYTQSISGSGGGAVYMIGLPYAAQNYNSMTHWVYGGFDNLPANFSPILRTQIGQSAIIFQAQNGGASSIDISPSNFGGGVNIMVSGTYVTAS